MTRSIDQWTFPENAELFPKRLVTDIFVFLDLVLHNG